MAKNTIPTVASISQSLKSAGRLVAKQAEQTKLAQYTLPSAFAELGKANYKDGARRGEFAELFATLDALVAEKAKTEEGRKARPSAEKLLEKAKKAALDAGDIARGKAEDFQIFRAASALGEAVYSSAGSAGVNDALSGRISSLKASLAALDEEIKTLADSKAFGQVSMKKALLGVAGACVAMTLLWGVMPRRTPPRQVAKGGSGAQEVEGRNGTQRVPSGEPSPKKKPTSGSVKEVDSDAVSPDIPTIKSVYLDEEGHVVIYDRPDPAYRERGVAENAATEYRQAAIRVGKLQSDLRKAEIQGSDAATTSRLATELAQARAMESRLKQRTLDARGVQRAKESPLMDHVAIWEADKRGRDATGRKFESLEDYLAKTGGDIPPYPANATPPIPDKDEYRALLKAPKRRRTGQVVCAMERLIRNGSTLQTEDSRDVTLRQLVFYNGTRMQSYFWCRLSEAYVVTEGSSQRSYLSVWRPEVLNQSRLRVSLEALQLNFGPTVASPLKSHGDAFIEQSVQELKAEGGEDLKEMPFQCVDGVVYFFGKTKDEKEFPELGKTRVELLGSLTIVNK
jgi:hypothetical protein